MPSEGDTIKVTSESITYDNLKFLEFDKGCIIINSLDINNPAKLELDNLENITDKHGNKTEGQTIRNLISESKFPNKFLSGISVKDYTYRKDTMGENLNSITGKKFIYLNDIDQIQSRKNATRNLLVLGFVLDAIIIAYPYFVLNAIF